MCRCARIRIWLRGCLCRCFSRGKNRYIYRLAYAIKKAQKRANALKNIVIPGLDSEIFRISDALEEKEREEFVRLKVVKGRNERLKGEQNAQND